MRGLERMIIALGVLIGAQAFAEGNPAIEQGFYRIDGTRSRTSALVRNGEYSMTRRTTPPFEEGIRFLDIHYAVNLAIQGNRVGDEILRFPEYLFTDKFIEDLRASGYIETPDFKVQHEAIVDVQTMDGKVYTGCDQFYAYDVKTVNKTILDEIARLNFAMVSDSEDGVIVGGPLPIDNISVRMSYCMAIPAGKAAKMDVVAYFKGIKVKIGADYIAPVTAK